MKAILVVDFSSFGVKHKVFSGKDFILGFSSLGSSVTPFCLDVNEILCALTVFLNFKIDLCRID